MKNFAIKDAALDAFMNPWQAPTRGAALRAFRKEINNNQGAMYDTPNDYDLYELGEFNDKTGLYTVQTPERVARGVDEREAINTQRDQ